MTLALVRHRFSETLLEYHRFREMGHVNCLTAFFVPLHLEGQYRCCSVKVRVIGRKVSPIVLGVRER